MQLDTLFLLGVFTKPGILRIRGGWLVRNASRKLVTGAMVKPVGYDVHTRVNW